MIVSLNREQAELKPFVEVPTTEEERAYSRAAQAEFARNVDWFGQHAKEIRDAHSGRYIVVFGGELFVGDDPREVRARAYAAHPELPQGPFSKRLSIHRGPRVYANQRQMAAR
ncbi:MAG: hypothetical protein U0791_23985 [Gemmataceae bacterium]